MKKVSKSSMAVMVATLLLGMLAGVVWARPNDGPQVEEITRKVTIPAAAFIPTAEIYDWAKSGAEIWCTSSICYWAAPVVFPCLPSVTVERIKLHLYDHNTSNGAGAWLYRSKPNKNKLIELGSVYSDGPGTTSDPATLVSPDINKVVWPSQGALLWLYVPTNISVYGVTVEYHRNT